MRRGLRRDGVLAGLLVALLGGQLAVTAAPASAAVCTPFVQTGYTVTVCLDAPGPGAVLSGSTEVTATVTVSPAGAAVVDRVQFTWGTANTFLLADHDAPYRMRFDTTWLPNGSGQLRARALIVDGPTTGRVGPTVTINNPAPPPPDGKTFTPWLGGAKEPGQRFRVAAVGDGVDGSPESEAVADQVRSAQPDVFAYLGDVYDRGTPSEFDTWYSDPNGFGSLVPITNPTVGNHEYMESATAAAYFEFWNEVPHYYSYDIGAWHVIVLDSTVEFEATSDPTQLKPGSPQYEWLARDLATHDNVCTMAYMHHARRTNVEGVNRVALDPVWRLLVDRSADLVLSGHAHNYERWTPMDGAGDPTAEGITQFVVGTAGRPILNDTVPEPRVVSTVTAPGALVLDLGATDAQFRFTSTDGSFTDSGTIPCRTAPDVAKTVTPRDGDDGWHRGDVSLDWQVTEPESPETLVTTGCEAQRVITDQPPTTYTCSATSGGGTTVGEPETIKRDGTPPTIAAGTSPPQPDGANGWYLANPRVDYSCGDLLSGVARCPDAVDVAEGVTTVTRTARDKAGNETESDVGPLSVDLTNPVVTCDAPPTYLLNQADATVSAEVTDAGSGPVRATESVPVTTSAVGRRSVSVRGSDRAGRTAADDCAYRVDYGFAGWDSPVDGGATLNVVTAGQAVPLKWRVLDAADLPVTSIGAVSLTSVAHGCTNGAVQDPLEVTAAGGSGLQNFGDGSYQLNWKTPKTYAGSCRTLRMDLGDGVQHTAEFRFTG